MADGEKRIVELTETQTFGNGDYLPLDNISNSETKKIEAKKLGITYTMTDTEDGFSFDGSNGYHYEKVIPKDAEMSYDDYEDLTEAEKMDGSNRFIPDYPEEEKQPEIWTRVGRTPLETDAKTISPAINELKERIDDSDTEIEEIKSNLTDLTEFSETEQVIGKWVNGKPIYRKTINYGQLPNNTTKDVAHNISNLDVVVNYYGIGWNTAKTDFRILPYSSSNDWILGLYVNATNVSSVSGKDFSFITNSYVTVEYTKTTD